MSKKTKTTKNGDKSESQQELQEFVALRRKLETEKVVGVIRGGGEAVRRV